MDKQESINISIIIIGSNIKLLQYVKKVEMPTINKKIMSEHITAKFPSITTREFIRAFTNICKGDMRTCDVIMDFLINTNEISPANKLNTSVMNELYNIILESDKQSELYDITKTIFNINLENPEKGSSESHINAIESEKNDYRYE